MINIKKNMYIKTNDDKIAKIIQVFDYSKSSGIRMLEIRYINNDAKILTYENNIKEVLDEKNYPEYYV